MIVSLYLAHLNPVTNAHIEIINELKSQSDHVYVLPVIFMKDGKEINSKSFPFSFEIRKKMLQLVFGDSITIAKNYTFFAPFSKYMPPLLSPKSWKLRRQILRCIKEENSDYFTYTGDKVEAFMLKLYRLNPRVGLRKNISASSVKNKLYDSVNSTTDNNWRKDVDDKVSQVIVENWDIIEKFSSMEDKTMRVLGMKFPKEGWNN